MKYAYNLNTVKHHNYHYWYKKKVKLPKNTIQEELDLEAR